MSEAETNLIGAALLTSGRVLDEIELEPSDFAAPALEALWRLMQSMRAKGQAVDLATLGAALRTAEAGLRNRITPADLHDMIQGTPTAGNADWYAGIVRDDATRRRIRAAATQIAQRCEETSSVDELADEARSVIDQAARVSASGVSFIGEDIDETIVELAEPPRFTPTPWGELNHLIGGWRSGGLYVVGARPGAGKSLVALQAALGLAERGSVAFSTLEMSKGEVHKRVIAQMAEVPMSALMGQDLTPGQWDRVRAAEQAWRDLPLAIDDRSGVSANMIKGFARSVNRRRPLAGLIVDYLQLMETAKGDKKRHEAVAEMTRSLKIFAREMRVPVIALSQLNRGSASREDGKPMLSDLRESGAIEQDADVVLLLHRTEEHPEDLKVLVAKNRHGTRGPITLDWQGHYSRVLDPGFRAA